MQNRFSWERPQFECVCWWVRPILWISNIHHVDPDELTDYWLAPMRIEDRQSVGSYGCWVSGSTASRKPWRGLGLLDQALTLDLRKPQDYFHGVWSTAFRARDLAAAGDTSTDHDDNDEEACT